MRQKLGQSIRSARRAAGFTQLQLGMRLGLKGRAVYRWENNGSAPTKRHQREMLAVIGAVNSGAASTLAAAFATVRQGTALAKPEPAAAPAVAAPNPLEAFELAIFRLADDLDLPPRRLRRPLARLCERLRAANFTLEAAQRQVESWIAEQQ
jgi:transcriptional regulator with XRE-family HTH domain